MTSAENFLEGIEVPITLKWQPRGVAVGVSMEIAGHSLNLVPLSTTHIMHTDAAGVTL